MLCRCFSLRFIVNILIVVLVSFLVFSFMGLTEKLPEKIVIGCLMPFSGGYAVFGEEAKIGMEFALQHINEAGGIQSLGGIPLELVAEDVGENVMSARLATESMISKHHPLAVLGLFISRLTVAASEITEREKVILIAAALVDDITEMGCQYLFRPYPKASIQGKNAVEFVLEAAEESGVPVKKIAILNENSSFGRSVATGAAQAALDNGLTIVYQQEYSYDITDVSSIVHGIAAADADFIVHGTYFMDGITFAKSFKELSKIPKFIAGMGGCGFVDPQSIEALGKTSEYYSNTYSYNPAKNTPQNRKFVEEYTAKTGYMPTEAGGMAYYGIWILKEALELSGTLFPNDPLNPDNLRKAFLELDLTSGPAVDTFPGNHISFDAKGDSPDAIATIMQVIKGEPKVVWPFDEAEAEFVFPRPDATY